MIHSNKTGSKAIVLGAKNTKMLSKSLEFKQNHF